MKIFQEWKRKRKYNDARFVLHLIIWAGVCTNICPRVCSVTCIFYKPRDNARHSVIATKVSGTWNGYRMTDPDTCFRFRYRRNNIRPPSQWIANIHNNVKNLFPNNYNAIRWQPRTLEASVLYKIHTLYAERGVSRQQDDIWVFCVDRLPGSVTGVLVLPDDTVAGRVWRSATL